MLNFSGMYNSRKAKSWLYKIAKTLFKYIWDSDSMFKNKVLTRKVSFNKGF